MNLKTATLIAIIGVIVSLVLSLVTTWGFNRYIFELPGNLAPLLQILNLIIFNGSIILFLAVFYYKQKEQTPV